MHSQSRAQFLLILIVCYLKLSGSLAASITSAPATRNEISHCSENFENPFNLRCSNLQNQNELVAVLNNLSDSTIILEVRHSKWKNFPLEAFHSVSLNTLIIANSSFHFFQNSSNSTPLQSIHHISLENVTFNVKPDWKDFSNLNNLRVLSIYNTTVRNKIDAKFGNFISKSVKSITIAGSNITDIEADSFRELTNLTYLRISHNSLRSLPKFVWENASSLEQLRLDYNRIHTLPSGVFENLPNLKVLTLSNNTISTLPEDVFSAIWKPSVYIELRDNPIKCDCRMLWAVTSQNKPENIVGQCAHPKTLYGRNLGDLKREDFKC